MIIEETTINQLKYVSEFRCDSSKCKQNCCQIYAIWIEDYDYELLNSIAPEIAKCINKDDGKYLIPSDEKSCVFIKDGLCSIHSKHGENTIPEVCYTYPRLYYGIDKSIYVSSNLLCDYIIKMIYTSNEPFKLVETASTRIPKYVDEQKKLTENNFKELYNNNIINLYKEVLKIVDNHNMKSSEIVISLIELANILDNNPFDKWGYLINNHIVTYKPDKTTESSDKNYQSQLFNLITDIFLNICIKEQNQRCLPVLNRIKENININNQPLTKEQDNILKTYIKIKLSENFFPLNAWYSCLTEISMIVSGYMLIKEALQSLENFTIDDVSDIITGIEPIMLIYRLDVFNKFYDQNINSYDTLKCLVNYS